MFGGAPVFNSAGAHHNSFFTSGGIEGNLCDKSPSACQAYLRHKGQLAIAEKIVSKSVKGQPMPEWCNLKLPASPHDFQIGPKDGIDPKPDWLITRKVGINPSPDWVNTPKVGVDPKPNWF